MKVYFGLTVFSCIMDIFAFFILIRNYGDPGKYYSEMTLMAFLFVFYATNMYWIGKIMLIQFIFPAYISDIMSSAFLTSGQHIQNKMRFWGSKAHEKMGRTAKRMKERVGKRSANETQPP